MRKFIVYFLITLVSSFAGIIVFEYSPIVDQSVKRLLFYSVNPWRRVNYNGEFFITLQPNETIRSYARYSKEIDYGTSFKTDAAGFRNSRQMESERFIISVVGDSFTMGSGGPNWVEKISNNHAELEPYLFYNQPNKRLTSCPPQRYMVC